MAPPRRAAPRLIVLVLAALVATCSSWSCGGSDEEAPAAQGGAVAPTAEEVRAILVRHRDAVAKGLPAEERARVDGEAAKHPTTAPSGTAPVRQASARPGTLSPAATPTDEDKSLHALVARRDWAYATLGITYSLRGGFEAGQAALLDVAFYCFLEAALLVVDEPEHLVNVAFHLNDRALFADARAVLLFARGLSPKNVAVRNNLAFATARLGDPSSAASEELAALSLAPARLFWTRLAGYWDAAKRPEEAAMARAMATDAGAIPTVSAVVPPASLAAANAFIEVLGPLQSSLTDGLAAVGGAPGIPMTLEYDLAMLPDIVAIRDRRAFCQQRVAAENADKPAMVRDVLVCEQCDRVAAMEERQLAHTYVNTVIAKTRTWASLTLIVVAEHLDKGLAGIAARSDLSPEDRAGLVAYWQSAMAGWVEVVAVGVHENVENARMLTAFYDDNLNSLSCGRGLVPSWVWNPDELLPFGGKITVWFVVGQLSIDMKKGYVELQGGQFVQGKIGWNWKTNDPLIGIGIGVNLDGIVETGAFISLDARSGLGGSIELSPAGWPMMIAGVDPPQIEKKEVIPKYATLLN